jgi:RNA polymerase sigma-70 factor, ECF subfamily
MRPSTQVQTDEELLRRIVAGDETAFTDLYRRRQAGVYRFALQMSGSESLAEDVTQEVFMVLVREAGKFDEGRGASVSAYLYGIARNQVLRRLERERPFVAMLEDHEEQEGAAPEQLISRPDPLAELARAELIDSVRQAVLALPAHYREVVVLCELHEMSYAEAASVLGCAVGTVRSRLHRARTLLLEKLSARGEREAGRESFNRARCFA